MRSGIAIVSLSALFVISNSGTYGQANTFPSSGNVGIGTTSPAAPLQVQGQILTTTGLTIDSSDYGVTGNASLVINANGYDGYKPYILLRDSVNQFTLGQDPSDSDKFKLSNSYGDFSATRLTITPGGNVGIGTTTPGSALDIYTPAAAGGATLLTLEPSSNPNASTELAWSRASDNWTPAAIGELYGAGQNYGGALAFYTHPDNGVAGNQSSPVEQMRILANGFIGIGTINPSATLDIEAPTGATPLRVQGASSNAFVYLSSDQALYLASNAVSPASSVSPTQDSPGLALRGTYWNGSSFSYADCDLYNFVTGPNQYYLSLRTNNADRLIVNQSGNVGIGTTNPTSKLSVLGTVQATEVIVNTGWSDFVFAPDYRLASLSEVEKSIKAEGHLPGIPSAKDVAEHGVKTGEMESKLLEKVEELTLHLIDMNKRQDAQAREIDELKRENAALLSGLR